MHICMVQSIIWTLHTNWDHLSLYMICKSALERFHFICNSKLLKKKLLILILCNGTEEIRLGSSNPINQPTFKNAALKVKHLWQKYAF